MKFIISMYNLLNPIPIIIPTNKVIIIMAFMFSIEFENVSDLHTKTKKTEGE